MINPIFFYALIFVAIPLGLFYLFSWLIIYHLKRYGLKGSYNNKAALVYSFGIIALSFMIMQRFIFTDWSRVSANDFIEESAINFYYANYGR